MVYLHTLAGIDPSSEPGFTTGTVEHVAPSSAEGWVLPGASAHTLQTEGFLRLPA